jgi:outer membrane protein TolC
MSTFRHFVAIGVGAAIALSCIESDASKKLPSPPKLTNKPAERSNAKPEVSLIPENLTEALQILQTAASPADNGNATAPATGDLRAVPSTSPVLTPPQAAELPVKKDGLTQSIVPSNSPVIEAVDNASRQTPRTAEAVKSLPTVGKEENTRQPVLYEVAIKDITPPISPTLPAVLPANHNSESNLIFPLRESSVFQSPVVGATQLTQLAQNTPVVGTTQLAQVAQNTPVLGTTQLAQVAQNTPVVGTTQLTQVAQNTPAPEFLNPSPNPLLFPTQSQEVQVQTLQPITLQQAIELAQRNNRPLQTAQLNLERSRFVLQEALAAEFPTAGVNANFTRTDSAQTSLSNARQDQNPPLDQLSRNPISSTFNTALQFNYDLYTSGRRPAQIRAAEKQIRFQELEVENRSQQLRLDVTTAYYNLQQADAQVEISRQAVTDAAQSLRDAALREQAGLGTRFEVLQAQVSLANANQDLTRALSQQRIRRRQIVQLLGLNQGVEVSAADPIEVAGDWNLSLEQSIVLAYKNRSELEQQLVQREISDQQRRIELAATRPQVTLNATYNILGVLNDGVGPQDGFTLGAGLQWNFFDGGRTRARANQQRTNIAIAENTFADQRNQIRLQIEQAFFDLSSSAQNIQTATFALVQAQESLRLARLRFVAGVGTQTDVITQQTELSRARGSRLTAILDYNRALATLQRGVSNLPDSNLSDLPNRP